MASTTSDIPPVTSASLATTREAIATIPLTLPIPARLHQAAQLIEAALQPIDVALSTPGAGGPDTYSTRLAALTGFREPVTRLIAPDAEGLRLPADRLAEAYLDMLFGRPRTRIDGREPSCLAALTQLYLRGALSPVQPRPAVDPARSA
jgi:hypothetical protein